MKNISAVIITYNEENNIERCIRSLMNLADEILVVDSYSTDNTIAICKSLHINVVQHAFEGHRQQKQWACEQAKFDYVLSLDADEVISEELSKSILHIKSNWNSDGYSMNRLNNYCGKWIKHCGWYPDAKIRLWDRRKGSWGGINPHDQVIMHPNSNVIHIHGDILHYTYKSISEHIAQLNKFTSIGAEEAFKNKKSTNLLSTIFKSIWKFIRDYFIKLGLLDGYYGFVICSISAFATFTKYLKLYELNKNG